MIVLLLACLKMNMLPQKNLESFLKFDVIRCKVKELTNSHLIRFFIKSIDSTGVGSTLFFIAK